MGVDRWSDAAATASASLMAWRSGHSASSSGLPIMLQIALFPLTCGLSRYMWSANASVARVVILFYIGIVVAGTLYGRPFQTPVSIALRHLRVSGIARTFPASLSPPNFISLIYTTQRKTRKFLVTLSLPSAISVIYAAWMNTRQRLISVSHCVHKFMRNPSSWC